MSLSKSTTIPRSCVIIIVSICSFYLIILIHFDIDAIISSTNIHVADYDAHPIRTSVTYIFMVDTRHPITPFTNLNHSESPYLPFHSIAASIANHYSAKYHYHFLYFVAECPFIDAFYHNDPYQPLPCKGHHNVSVPTPWMKVKGILKMLSMMDDGDIALYIDTDVLMNHSHSIDDFITNDLNGSFDGIALCWDYASFWTSYARNIYDFPINSGTILFRKTKSVEILMQKWWESVSIPSKMDIVRNGNATNIMDADNGNDTLSRYYNHALQWPFEQDRLSWIVDTKLFDGDIVLFKEDRKVHPSISNHLTTLEDDPDEGFMRNYTKLVFIRQCEGGYIEWYHRRIVLSDDCDENVNDNELDGAVADWLTKIQVLSMNN